MNECVEKQALKSHLKLEADCGHVSTLQDVFDIIDFIPAANVRPVVRGQWEKKVVRKLYVHLIYECTACNYFADQVSNFCPHCGADMQKEGVTND